MSELELVKKGQNEACEFTGYGMTIDGIWGPETNAMAILCLQTAMNLDYDACLDLDGQWGPRTASALSGHYVRQGETQFMVSALEIILMLRGYDPDGVEYPGQFERGCESAVRAYQADNGLEVDGVAGENTFCSLLGVSMSVASVSTATGSAAKVIEVARSQIGYKEDGNYTKFGDQYGDPYGEWCGYFVAWCFLKAGVADKSMQGDGCGYVPYIQQWYLGDDDACYYSRANYPDYVPQPGDVIIFTWDGTSRDHVGFVESYGGGNSVTTIEGNTGDGTPSVMRRTRSMDCILGFCHPDW